MTEFFDIYIGTTNGLPDDWTIISTSELNDVLSQCTKIDKVWSKPSINVEPVEFINSPDGTQFVAGEYIKISFTSNLLSKEEYEFLRLFTQQKVMVIYYDPSNNGLIYGVKDLICEITPHINEEGKQYITYYGQTINGLYLYSIGYNIVRINYPRNGFIYNNQITSVYGYIS